MVQGTVGTLLYKYSTLMVRVAAAGPRVGVVVIVSRKISPLGLLASVLQAASQRGGFARELFFCVETGPGEVSTPTSSTGIWSSNIEG